ncbi:MAG TPA: hypothetical protein ACHBX6_11525 [Arsenophonus nasoniae]|uniref:hypothetical protein n=1 Tax=Arsenophonus nasoniae TaxID=638 RepID=UPI00387A203B
MKIEFINEGDLSRIWITDYFWKKRKALNFLDNLNSDMNNVSVWVCNGIKFQITIHGKSRYILRIYKLICSQQYKIK